MKRSEIFDLIDVERLRQEDLAREGKFAYTCASKTAVDEPCAVILTEEVGEVCRAILDKDFANLKEELIQVAAVAVAWLERLEK